MLGRRGDPGAQYPWILSSLVQQPGVSLSLLPGLERWGRGSQHTTAEVWRFVGDLCATWNLDHGWPWRAIVAGVGHRSTVVYRAWMQSSWVRWVPFCRCLWNGNESHRTFNVVLVCCSCSIFFNCSVYFFPIFGGEEATTFFSGEVLCWRGFVRQDCHCKCAAEYIQMSLILGRAPCQTEALKWRWFHGGKATWGCDHLRKIGCCFYSACILY